MLDRGCVGWIGDFGISRSLTYINGGSSCHISPDRSRLGHPGLHAARVQHMLMYADVCSRMLTYSLAGVNGARVQKRGAVDES